MLHSTTEQRTVPDTSQWPLLLKNYTALLCRSGRFTPIPCGHSPNKRPISELLKYGVVHLDKPPNPSSHEIVSWVKRILKCEKTGHSGTLDPAVTGCLVICIDRATRIAKSQQSAGKEYVALLQLSQAVPLDSLRAALRFFTGRLYQCPPAISAVKKQLRVRTVYENELIEYNQDSRLAIFRVSCEAGTYIRTLCEHIGLHLGVGGTMAELRRTRTGALRETDGLVTMHDLLDAKWALDQQGDETYIRRCIRPLEWLLTNLKRIIVRDNAVDAVCHGAQVMLAGVLRYAAGIEAGEQIVIVTTKGEAVALAISQMTSDQISIAELHDQMVVAKIKRVIMDRGTYTRCWGIGPVAQYKKQLMGENLMDKYGKPNANTPKEWLGEFLKKKLEQVKRMPVPSSSQPDC